jgi:hypothetical protein
VAAEHLRGFSAAAEAQAASMTAAHDRDLAAADARHAVAIEQIKAAHDVALAAKVRSPAGGCVRLGLTYFSSSQAALATTLQAEPAQLQGLMTNAATREEAGIQV